MQYDRMVRMIISWFEWKSNFGMVLCSNILLSTEQHVFEMSLYSCTFLSSYDIRTRSYYKTTTCSRCVKQTSSY